MSVEPTIGEDGLSVPLAVHLAELRAADKELYAERDRRYEAQREADQLAIEIALDASKELAARHNDLIRAGEKKEAQFATVETTNRIEAWQARFSGGLLVVASIGIANLVKAWGG